MKEDSPNTCWIAAYAVGMAFSPLDDEAALAQLREAGTDPAGAAAARSHLARMAVDDGTRNRALHLLDELSAGAPSAAV